MAESKRTEAGGTQPASRVVGPAVQPPREKCGSSCPGADAKAMPYAVPMVTGIGPVTDLTKGADVSEPMVYAVPMVSGLGPVIDLTQPQIVRPLADEGVSRVVDGAAFVDLTQARVVPGAPAPGLVQPPSLKMSTRSIIGKDSHTPELDTTKFPQRTVVQIVSDDLAGTGVLIGPRRVLTCAHNVLDVDNQPVSSIYVVPALADADMPFGDAWAQEVILDPKLRAVLPYCVSLKNGGFVWGVKRDCSPLDLAVIILDRPLGTDFVGTSDFVYAKAREWGSCNAVYQVESYGYPGMRRLCPGETCPMGDLPSYQMYHVDGWTRPLGKNIPAPPPGLPGCQQFHDPEVIYFDLDFLEGQSGSPVLLKAGTAGKLGGRTSIAVGTRNVGSPQREPLTVEANYNSGPLITTRRAMFLASLKAWDSKPVLPFAEEDYTGWTPLGSAESLRPPAIVAYGANRLDVVFSDSFGLLFWARWENGHWSGPLSLNKVVTHAPSVAVRPSGQLHIAARQSDNTILAGVLGADQAWHWESLKGEALDAPTIVATDENRVHLFFLSQDPNWSGKRTEPRRTVGWYSGVFGETDGAWEWKGYLGASASGMTTSIRSRIGAVAISPDEIALAGVNSVATDLVWTALAVSPKASGTALWQRNFMLGANKRFLGSPALVNWGHNVHALVRSEPINGGQVHRAQIPPLHSPSIVNAWVQVELPSILAGEITGVVDAADELLVFGRACVSNSATHGAIVGVATLASGAIVRHYDAGGTMIDVRAAILGDSVWLFARGRNLKLHFRTLNPYAGPAVTP